MGKELINPVEIGRSNICPKCVTPSLYLIEKNLDMTYIDDIGNPTNHQNLSHSSKLICGNCRRTYDYKKRGNKFIIYTEEEQVIDMVKDMLQSRRGEDDSIIVDLGHTDSEDREDDYI